MVMLETVQRIANTSLKTAYAKYCRSSAQSISASTLTPISYNVCTSSNTDILTLSNGNIWIDSRVKMVTIDVSQSADQNYNYYFTYSDFPQRYCTAQGTYFQINHSWAGKGSDATLAINVYGAAGSLVYDNNWNYVYVTVLYV